MPETHIYLAGAITHAGEEQLLDWYQALAETLQQLGHTVFLPYRDLHTPKHTAPEQIHEKNMIAIEQAEWVVAYVGMPSLGVGMTLQKATELNKPTLLLSTKDQILSEMILHTPNVKQLIRFSDREEAIKLVVEYFS